MSPMRADRKVPEKRVSDTRRPFAEQLAFFRRKLARLVPTKAWDDLTRAEHDKAFMVAGATKAELLSDLGAAVDRAIGEGKSLEAFRKDFEAAVARHGWEGWTGSDTKGGRAWRTRVIYRTNASTSYAAGRYAQLVQGKFAFWVYRHGGSEDPRPEHLALDGLMLPPDHPFWRKFYPPSDWGCSCYVLGARSIAEAKRMGGKPELTLPDWWNATDPATGAPPGIGKGWDYAPGESVAESVGVMAGKIGSWDHRIAKAFMEELPVPLRDALAESYRALPSVADDTRRYARRILGGTAGVIEPARTLGAVTSTRADGIDRLLGGSVEGYDFAIDRSAIEHILKRHGNSAAEAARGQIAVTPEDYAMLPTIVSKGELGQADAGRIELRLRIGGKEYVTIWEVRGKRRSLALVTFWVARVRGK